MAVKRYNGSSWDVVAGVGAQGAAATSSTITTWVKTAAGGETSLSGNDDNSQSLSYTIGQELVFINGVLQKRGADYTANTGTSITGLAALTASDVVTVWSNNAFSVSNAISNTIVDAKGDILVGTSADTPGRLAVGTDGQVLTADSTTGTGLKWSTAASFVGVSAYKVSTSQTVSANTFTTVTFDGEFFDSDGFHDNSTNNSRFTVPSGKAGKYIILARTIWNEYNKAKVSSYIRKNGSTTIAYSVDQCPTDYWETHQIFCIADLSVGDYVELAVEQNGGGNRSIHGDNNATAATMFQMAKVG